VIRATREGKWDLERQSSKCIPATAAVLSLAATTVIITYPQASQLSSAVGSHSDAMFSVWRLAWVAHALIAAPARLFDANIFYPQIRTLAYSDAILLPAIVMAPLQWCHVPSVVVYNVALLTAFFFSAFAMCCLVRSLTGSWYGGVIAGVGFAFSSHQLEHYERLEIQLAFWMPFTLLALHRTVTSGRMRDGATIGFLAAAQIYSGVYNGIFLLTYLTAATPFIIFIERRTSRAVMFALLTGLAVAAIAAIPYLIPYVQNRAALGDRSLDEIQAYSAVYRDYLAAHPNNILYGTTLRFPVPGAAERFLFPGMVVVALALCGVRPRARRISLAYLAMLMFSVEMSRGTNSPLYAWLYDHVFLYRGLRAPARFGVLVQLSLAVLAGFGIERLCTAITNTCLRGLLLGVLLLGVVVECRAHPPLRPVEPPSRVYAWLRRQPLAPVLEYPVPDPGRLDVSHDVTYMVNSIEAWYPLLNGQSGFFPQSYLKLLIVLRRFPRQDSVDYAARMGARYILVHERYMPDKYRSVTSELGALPNVELVAVYAEGDHEVAIYRLVSPMSNFEVSTHLKIRRAE
jgi:hypothetical protein